MQKVAGYIWPLKRLIQSLISCPWNWGERSGSLSSTSTSGVSACFCYWFETLTEAARLLTLTKTTFSASVAIRTLSQQLHHSFFFYYLATILSLKLCSVGGRMINEYGADGAKRIGKGIPGTRNEGAPVPFCVPPIHDLSWDLTQVTAAILMTEWRICADVYV
jgi:hypothetical protein